LLLVFVKANRDPGAWLIFIPLLIVNLLWSVLTRFLGVTSANMAMFSMLFHSHVIGIAALWLLGHKIGNRNRLVTFLLALSIMAVAGLTGVTSYGMTGFSEETAAVLMLLAVLTFTMLLGFVLTGWRCRNRYSNLRFMLWLAFWFVAACVASMLTFYSVMFAIYQIPLSIFTILLRLSIVALVLGLCLYAIVLPYMILALRSSFFRRRFYGCFHLPAMAEPSTDGSDTETAKRNDISDLDDS